jgi:acetate kinase
MAALMVVNRSVRLPDRARDRLLGGGARGLDALVFTGGIGENDAATRAEVANACTWLGLRLDEAANSQAATRISAQGSRVVAFVIPTNEELQIATRTFEITHPS